jgi:hypothetical protein
MFNLPTKMRQEIAARPEIADPLMQRLLAMAAEPLQVELDKRAGQMKARGISPLVIVAYQALAPALRENRAVQAYRAQTGNSAIANALPDVATADEAVSLAVAEWHLNAQEQQQLLDLLIPLEP